MVAARPAARRTKVFSVARAVAQPAVRSLRALVEPKVVEASPVEASPVEASRAAASPVAVELLVVVAPRAAVVLPAVAVPRVAAARPVVAPQVACLTLEAGPLAVVRADIPLQAVARAVAAAVE
jgi:hypothetical protein